MLLLIYLNDYTSHKCPTFSKFNTLVFEKLCENKSYGVSEFVIDL